MNIQKNEGTKQKKARHAYSIFYVLITTKTTLKNRKKE